MRSLEETPTVQGYLAHKNLSPSWDHHRALGIGLLQGPRGGAFIFAFFPKTSFTSWSSTGSISDSATVTLVSKRVLAAFLRDPAFCAT